MLFLLALQLLFRILNSQNNPFDSKTIKGATAGGNLDAKSGYYETIQGKTFATTINIQESTTVKMIFHLVTKSGRVCSNEELFSEIMVNGSSTMVERLASSVIGGGWDVTNTVTIEMANLTLNAGENLISFTMGSSLNVNAVGISFESFAAITLVSI